MGFFSSLFSPPRSRPVAAKRRPARLALEALERRIVPATHFVVPASFANGVNQYATLSDALNSGSLASGDIIEIQPGAAPGNLSLPVLPPVSNLTIQGDLRVSLSAIPELTVSNALLVNATATGLTLKNLNVQFVGAGSLTADPTANISLIGSHFSDFSSSATEAIRLGGTANVLEGSTFTAGSGNLAGMVVISSPIPSSNVIRGNTFVATALAQDGDLLRFMPVVSTTTNDVVTDNTFVGNSPADDYTMISIESLTPTTALAGLTIRHNFFQELGGGVEAIHAVSPVQSLLIQGNHFNLRGFDSTAIVISGGENLGATVISATIDGNSIAASGGTGIRIELGALITDVVEAKIQGNSFHGSRLGVLIENEFKLSPLSGIDIGGGALGSLGGNDFRDFYDTASTGFGAIVAAADIDQPITARMNFFLNGLDPTTLVYSTGTGTIDVTVPQSGNVAFVSALYSSGLLRAGDPTTPADSGQWVDALNAGASHESVAYGVMHSEEALGVLVDKMYLLTLDRASDAGGRAYFVAQLQGGATLESVMTSMLASAEYTNAHPGDADFVLSLYRRLLNRAGEAPGVAAWMNVAATQGRGAVIAGILGSAEFRKLAVERMYGFDGTNLSLVAPPPNALQLGGGFNTETVSFLLPNFLHRDEAPAQADVNAWVGSGLDLMSIALGFASGDEYYFNG